MNEVELRAAQLEKLKKVAKTFLCPQDNLPFSVVVEAMTDREVLPIEKDGQNREMLRSLANACVRTTAESQREPISARRPNEVSSQIETRLDTHLTNEGLRVERPRSADGRGRSAGYPDRLLFYQDRPIYLEVKASREENVTQGSARNFFFKPSANHKIQHRAPHLLAGFSLREVRTNSWELTGWKIVDLFNLEVSLKPEYNANNLEIYRDAHVLLSGDQDGIRA